MRNLKQELTNWKGNKTLMVVFPHPDDETVASGGLLMAAKDAGWKTIVVILTQGEAGQNRLKGELKSIRVEELKKSTTLLDVDQLVHADFGDGRLKENAKWTSWLGEQIMKYNPGWIVTYDHSGISGHPDHIALSLQSKNWKPKIWWVTFPHRRFIRRDIHEYLTPATHKLALTWGQTFKKYQAVFTHRSQYLPIFPTIYTQEYYHEFVPSGNYTYKFVDFNI